MRLIYTIIISAISLLGVIVCAICNFAISGNLTWALFPISSIIFAWITITPAAIWSKKGISISLIMFSLFIIPFLFTLEQIIGVKRLILPMGIPISAVSILYLWEIYFLLHKSNLKKYAGITFALASGMPVSLWINIVISKFTQQSIIDIWDVLTYSILAVTSIVIFMFGYFKYRKITK